MVVRSLLEIPEKVAKKCTYDTLPNSDIRIRTVATSQLQHVVQRHPSKFVLLIQKRFVTGYVI